MKRPDWSRRLIGCGLSIALGLAACGGSGTSTSGLASSTPASANGAALVTLTDAPGDFLSYMVNVVSLKLTRADGTVVETVPTTTAIDFAQLVNLSEVVSAQQIPIGRYVSASMTLDYSNASIVIDNGAGGLAVAANNIISGSTTTPLVSPNNRTTVSLQLPSASPLVVTAGSVANLALDFNLAISNTVAPATITPTTAAASVTVTVNPVLTASLVPDTTKDIEVRGPLVSVADTGGASSYTVNVRPFFNNAGSQGQLVVNTTATTAFAINGVAASGSAGLTALATIAAGTMTYASGSFDISTKTFTATSVVVSSTASGVDLDRVEGTVTARIGNTLMVGDGLADARILDIARFHPQMSVTVGSGTAVTEAGQTGSFTPQDISVGQHAQFFGTLTTDAAGNTTMDATAGSVRLRPTSLVGQVVSSTATSVTLTLEYLDGLAPTAFSFAGTGATTAADASAAAYQVSVPASLLSGPIAAGTALRLAGFVTPFGTAPPDFAALSLVDYANTAASLRLEWALPGVTAPFTAPLSATHAVLSQATIQSAAEHLLRQGPLQPIDASTVGAGVSLVADAAAVNTAFAIEHWNSQSIDTFTSFADLIAAVGTQLNGTTDLLELDARGPYDASTSTLSVDQLVIVLGN